MEESKRELLAGSLGTLLNKTLDHFQSREALSIVAQYAMAFTRGAGFDEAGNPNDDLAAVILTATARLLSNPGQVAVKSVGGMSLTFRSDQGWTVGERLVLNRYRQRTA